MKKSIKTDPLILVLEDQPDTLFAIRKALKPDYETFEASNIAEAEKALDQHDFIAFLLDLNLPDGSSFDFIEKLKINAKSKNTPILILTASDQSEDVVLGFNLGVDDFIKKPFNCFELKARLKNRIAKSFQSKRLDPVFLTEQVSIDPKNFEAIVSTPNSTKKIIKLTRIEMKILTMLQSKAPNHISREKICTSISDIETFETRKVDQHIKNIRKKFSPVSLIKSSYGIGYYLDTKSI